ncbi:TPA: hypothetical protein EYH33_06065, partial [Candidatus Bipolaricaulota bacterium]|nr:hypothetical protein [Candidatus Bipolaricaulota bacterium]
ATGGWDKLIILWDTATWQVVRTLSGHSWRVNGVAFSPDGQYLASCSSDRTVRLWEVATGRELAALAGHEDSVTAVAFRPQGDLVASAGADTVIILWDVSSLLSGGSP